MHIGTATGPPGPETPVHFVHRSPLDFRAVSLAFVLDSVLQFSVFDWLSRHLCDHGALAALVDYREIWTRCIHSLRYIHITDTLHPLWTPERDSRRSLQGICPAGPHNTESVEHLSV